MQINLETINTVFKKNFSPKASFFLKKITKQYKKGL